MLGLEFPALPTKVCSSECLEGAFSEVHGGHLAPGDAFATMQGAGTKSFESIEQGRLGRVLACKGGMRYGRREAAAEAGRSRTRRPRHGADRLDDARLDDRHH